MSDRLFRDDDGVTISEDDIRALTHAVIRSSDHQSAEAGRAVEILSLLGPDRCEFVMKDDNGFDLLDKRNHGKAVHCILPPGHHYPVINTMLADGDETWYRLTCCDKPPWHKIHCGPHIPGDERWHKR